MDAAERRVTQVGFNGFSYADIASELGLTTASIHYHFPAKADLGVSLIERCEQRLREALAQVHRLDEDPVAQMRRLCAVSDSAARAGGMCLSGMLAAEFATLPRHMQERVRTLIHLEIQWLSSTLHEGVAKGRFVLKGDKTEAAHALASALHGAVMVSRVHGGHEAFKRSIDLIIEQVCQPVESEA
ncbi:MAG: TetR/AcrR family transcriptional regulator [Hyphomonadaceae bacterium]|nr:TetR/AcrR family transcriptional regulator [Hyphomonadaceae bacterium]